MSAAKAGLPWTSLTASTLGSGLPTDCQPSVSGATRICGITLVRVASSGPAAGLPAAGASASGAAKQVRRRRDAAVDRLHRLAPQDRRRPQDGLHRLQVAGATAQHTGERLAHLRLAGVGLTAQQRLRSQDHGRRAVAALDGAGFDEGLLQRVQPGCGAPAQLRVLTERLHRLQAGPSAWAASITQAFTGSPSKQHGAGAALAGLAAVLDAVDPQVLAQRPEQGGIPGDLQLGLFAVEQEGDLHAGDIPWAKRETRICGNSARYSALAHWSPAAHRPRAAAFAGGRDRLRRDRPYPLQRPLRLFNPDGAVPESAQDHPPFPRVQAGQGGTHQRSIGRAAGHPL